MSTTCENCGCRVYKLGCVNCDEENYIEEQIMNTEDTEDITTSSPSL